MDSIQLQHLLSGEKEAFQVFFQLYFDKAVWVATSITQDKELALEATQETFIRIYRFLDKYDKNKPFDPWFYKILTNECNRVLSKENKVILMDKEVFEDHLQFSDTKDELAEDLHEIIHRLEDAYRIPLILKYIKGFSEREIAEILEMNHNTVKTRLLKARELLQRNYNHFEEGRNPHA